MKKENPYLLWLSEQEKAETLFQIVRFKKPGSTVAVVPKNLKQEFASIYRSYSRLVRKLEYVSYVDQDNEETPLSRVRYKHSRTTMSEIGNLCERFAIEHPEKSPDKTTVEEFFYWYYTKHRSGLDPLEPSTDSNE